jgi:single-stranded-DNA-specific exonuclease
VSSPENLNSIWKPRTLRTLLFKEAPVGMPLLIWNVLNARGFESEEVIQKWLTPSLKILRDPYALKDMDKAVARLLRAFKSGEKICIYADYDLDGTSGLALLTKGLQLLGFQNVVHYQPRRLSEGYGIHEEAVRKLFEEGVKLLISVDLGITAIHEVAVANELGLDVIITDHHLPKDTLPAAVAVVNPNRTDCEAGLGHLCGTGVAFYLVLALRRALLEQGLLKTDFDPKLLLDCFVIGTLTDMVPLIDENRVLVKHGLRTLAETKRPGLRVLLQALGLWGQPLSSQDVAIRFAPKLNALSRMEMGIQPIDLYLIEDEASAQNLVERVLANNQTRMASQKGAELDAFEQLEKSPPQGCAWVYSSDFHRGILGLVATKVSQKYQMPAFIGSLGEDGQIVGSARLPDSLGHLNLLDAFESASDVLTRFGGHSMAAGFEISQEKAPELGRKLSEFFLQKNSISEPRAWVYDAEARLADLNTQFMTWYDHLSPFGVQFSTPLFLLKDVQIAQIKALKGGHYRLTLKGALSDQFSHAALWFSPNEGHSLLAEQLKPGLRVDVLAEAQWNYFNGNKSLQLLVQDLRKAE